MQRKFYTFLEEIEQHPEAYAIDGVEDIYIFIQGYAAAFSTTTPIKEDEDYLHFCGFSKWVERKYEFLVNPYLESNYDWLQIIRLESRNSKHSLAVFFSLLNEFKKEGVGKINKLIPHFEYVVTESFLHLIRYKKFKINYRKSSQYVIYFENDKCTLQINTTRYLDNFIIYLINPKTKNKTDIFRLLELTKGANSLIQKHLKALKSDWLKPFYFSERSILFDKINHSFESIKALKILDEIIFAELAEILAGNFDFEDKIYFHNKKRDKKDFQTKEAETNYEEDKKIIYRTAKTFPEFKVVQEITNNQHTKLHSFPPKTTRYQLTAEEQDWVDKLLVYKEEMTPTLSYEYLSAFEKKFDLSLPRYYKLYLNFIGNGRGIKRLERSIVHYDGDSAFFEFIDLQQRFDEYRRPILFTGVLRIYDFGCGISYFLVVNGTDYGKIWIDDRANSGKIYPFVNSQKIKVGFKEWVEIFGVKSSIGVYTNPHPPVNINNIDKKNIPQEEEDDLPF